jgi:hypothetical protein
MAPIEVRISNSLEAASGFVKDFQRCLEELESPVPYRMFPLIKTEMYMFFSNMVNYPFCNDLLKRNHSRALIRRDRGLKMVVREYEKV